MGQTKHLSAASQVIFIFGLISALLVAIGIFLFLGLRTIENHNDKLQAQILKEWTLSNDLSRNLRLEQLEVYRHLQTNDGAEKRAHDEIISNAKAANTARWGEYEKLVDNPEETRLYANALEARKKFWTETNILLSLSRANQDAEARNLAVSSQATAYEAYQKALIDIADATAKEGGELATASTRVIVQTRRIGDTLVSVATLVAIGTALLLIRITRRLKEDNCLLLAEAAHRKKTEQELQWKTALLEAQVNSSIDGIMVVDSEQRKIIQNQRVNDLWKIPPEIADDPDANKQLQWVMKMTRDPAKFLERVLRLKSHPEEINRGEIELKDGTVMDRYSGPVVGKKGEYFGRITTFRDITEQSQARKELEENRLLLEGILKNSLDGVIAYESIRDEAGNLVDFRFLMVNPAAERLLGEPALTLVGKGLLEISPEIVLDGLFESFVRVVKEGKPLDFEYSAIRSQSLLWYRVAAVKLGDGLVMSYSDVTERKRATQRLDRMFQLSLDIMCTTSHDGYIRQVNPAGERILRRTREELLAQPFVNFIHPDDLASFADAMSHISAGQTTMGFEIRCRCGDGSYKWIQWNSISAPDEELFYTTGRDITDRKLAEEQLKRLGLQHELVLNAVGEGVHWIGSDGRIKFENPAGAKMLGYSPAELVGMSAHITMHHTRADGAPYPVDECPVYATISSGKGHRVKDEVFWRKDGTSFPVEYTSTPVSGEDDQLAGTVVVFSDVSERKRIEARLLQSQKMETVGKLAGGVAHEFNSILTAIIGQTELLLNDLPAGNPLAKSATEIRLAADRAAGLTRQLLAYGRKQILQPEILDLNLVLAEMESTLNHLMGHARLRIVPGAGLKAVKIDPGQMEQVIVNIAMNAGSAMPNGGSLTLETSNVTLDEEFVRPFPGLTEGDYVLLALSDTGTGMKEEIKAHIFEPFFSTKGVGEGTGLGLATCYGIIKQSGGHINVYSEMGRGSTFKIYLPQVGPQKKTLVPRAVSASLPRGNETILLAEDDPSLLEMSATFLRTLGYTVLTASNGVAALGLKHQRDVGHIDLLFTDVVMPHMSGKELSDRIHAIYPDTKILFTSAYTENAIVHQGVLDKGVMLLQKPFTPSALAHKIRNILDS